MVERLWCTPAIASVAVPVVIRPRTHDEIVAGTIGQFDKIRCCIWIGDDVAPELAEQTLGHELGHAILYLYGIDAGDYDEEERSNNSVSAAVFDTLKRNGMLLIPARP